jgi:dihydrofolate reductase
MENCVRGLCVIVAATPDGGIGYRGQIPWDLPGDRRWFREWTRGDTVVMGRRTWESLGHHRRPLPDRYNIVVSSSLPDDDDVTNVRTVSEAIARAATETVWIIGGASMYDETLPRAEMVVLTTVYGPYACDVHVPAFRNLGAYGFRCAWTSRLFSGAHGRYRYRIFTRDGIKK